MASAVEELLLVIDNENQTFITYNEGICQSKYGQVWMYISNDLHQFAKISILMNYEFCWRFICVWYPKTMKLGVSKPCFPDSFNTRWNLVEASSPSWPWPLIIWDPIVGEISDGGWKFSFEWHLPFGKLSVGPWKYLMFLVETHLQTPICQGLC